MTHDKIVRVSGTSISIYTLVNVHKCQCRSLTAADSSPRLKGFAAVRCPKDECSFHHVAGLATRHGAWQGDRKGYLATPSWATSVSDDLKDDETKMLFCCLVYVYIQTHMLSIYSYTLWVYVCGHAYVYIYIYVNICKYVFPHYLWYSHYIPYNTPIIFPNYMLYIYIHIYM